MQDPAAQLDVKVVPGFLKIGVQDDRGALGLYLCQFLNGSQESIGVGAPEGVGQSAVKGRFQLGLGGGDGLGQPGFLIALLGRLPGRTFGERESRSVTNGSITVALTEAGKGQRPPALSGLQVYSTNSFPCRVLLCLAFIA